MTSLAYYRLPYSDRYTTMESDSEPLILSSYESIGGESGFVIAPFAVSAECPIVLIRPDRVAHHSLSVRNMQGASVSKAQVPKASETKVSETKGMTSLSSSYAEAFGAYHDAVSEERFHKLVLARKKEMAFPGLTTTDDARSLFEKACLMYPRLMIILFSTPQTGTWIIASPEILIEGSADNYHTVALAGTMPYSEGYLDWSDKNKAEQHIVEEYIENTLSASCSDILKDGPVTMRAGNLAHLRTDFRFHLHPETMLGSLVNRLHPTPAVCGLPKHEAREFILCNEGIDRRYYSGFAGPVGIDGETHLYVSLRCAELFPSSNTQHPSSPQTILYAGGGIMPGSSCESEWMETESKMKTIKNVLQ